MEEKDNILEDYYKKYKLDKTKSTKDIRKELMSILGDVRNAMSGAALNDKEIQEKLDKESQEMLEALKVFKSDEKRKKYDSELSVQINKEEQLVTKDSIKKIYRETPLEDRIKRQEALKSDIQECRGIIKEANTDEVEYE